MHHNTLLLITSKNIRIFLFSWAHLQSVFCTGSFLYPQTCFNPSTVEIDYDSRCKNLFLYENRSVDAYLDKSRNIHSS